MDDNEKKLEEDEAKLLARHQSFMEEMIRDREWREVWRQLFIDLHYSPMDADDNNDLWDDDYLWDEMMLEEDEEVEAWELARHQRFMARAFRELECRKATLRRRYKNPKIFIAVQCSNCLTMQVKEKKKRRNKWKCDFCEEMHSASKALFEGTFVKEVEKFAQDFNMSENLAGESGKDVLVSSFGEEIDGPLKISNSSQRKRRREPDNDNENDLEGEQQQGKGNKQPMEEVQTKNPRSNKMD